MTKFYDLLKKQLSLIIFGVLSFSFMVPTFSQVKIMVKTHDMGGEVFTTAAAHSTWTTATYDLQAAIDAAANLNGVEIWVAGGTYLPTKHHNPFTDGTTPPEEDRSKSFIPANGVIVTGGFIGTETSLEERPSDLFGESNATILSGDLGVENDNSDNSFHVVYFLLGTDNTAILRDLVIANGNSTTTNSNYHPYSQRGGGLHMHGGGMVENCHIRNNTAEIAGGGAYLYKGGILSKCMIYNNSAGENGGGVNLNLGGEVQESVVYNNHAGPTNSDKVGNGGGIFMESSSDFEGNVNHSIIVGNKSGNKAGGIGFLDGGISANNLVANNFAEGNGGGIHLQGGGLILNNTIVANRADGGAGLMANLGGAIINTVIWGNQTRYPSNTQFVWNGEITLKNLAIENYNEATGITNLITLESTNEGAGIHPEFVNPISFIGLPTADQLEEALNADYHVGLNSALLDAGTPDVTEFPLSTTDLNGDARIIKELVDIGAYETLYYNVSSSVVDNMGGLIAPEGITHLLPGASHQFILTPETDQQVASFTLNEVETKDKLTAQDACFIYTLLDISEDVEAIAEFTPITALNEPKPSTLQIYPNPASGIINFSGEGLSKAEIYSLSGKLMKTLYHSELGQPANIANLTTGIYFVVFTLQDGKKSLHKLIKE